MNAILLSTFSALLPFQSSAFAANPAEVVVSVQSTAQPWRFKERFNAVYAYGLNDGSDPTVVSAASGIDVSAGKRITIAYLSGTVAPSPNLDRWDADGDQGYLANDTSGSSQKYFPSWYIPASSYPVRLCALIGVFTDRKGAIVGMPFLVGKTMISVIVPRGATQFQLGINDDHLADNRGAYLVKVSGAARGR